MTTEIQAHAAALPPPERNEFFGYPIPNGHLAVLDFERNSVSLYYGFYRIPYPDAYLERYYAARSNVPPPVHAA